jgi:hypothetical protein
LLIGEETAVPWVHNAARVGSPTVDKHGVVYTIAPGVEDKPADHLVVIENWVDSVITPAETSAGS